MRTIITIKSKFHIFFSYFYSERKLAHFTTQQFRKHAHKHSQSTYHTVVLAALLILYYYQRTNKYNHSNDLLEMPIKLIIITN